jgi:hypothetical protein
VGILQDAGGVTTVATMAATAVAFSLSLSPSPSLACWRAKSVADAAVEMLHGRLAANLRGMLGRAWQTRTYRGDVAAEERNFNLPPPRRALVSTRPPPRRNYHHHLHHHSHRRTARPQRVQCSAAQCSDPGTPSRATPQSRPPPAAQNMPPSE